MSLSPGWGRAEGPLVVSEMSPPEVLRPGGDNQTSVGRYGPHTKGTPVNKPRKKNALALLAGVAVAAVVTASAATLGGVNAQELGADSNDVVAPITEGVSVTWDTSYHPGKGHYVVDGFTLTPTGDETIPADAEVQVTVSGTNGEKLAEYTGTGGGYMELDDTDAIVAAHDVHGAAVVITSNQ